MASKLSDKAVAVFAFAAYHEMSSGETVVDVVLKDGPATRQTRPPSRSSKPRGSPRPRATAPSSPTAARPICEPSSRHSASAG